jgi:hypothetical protein
MNSFETSQRKPLIHDESLKRKKFQENAFSPVSEESDTPGFEENIAFSTQEATEK